MFPSYSRPGSAKADSLTTARDHTSVRHNKRLTGKPPHYAPVSCHLTLPHIESQEMNIIIERNLNKMADIVDWHFCGEGAILR